MSYRARRVAPALVPGLQSRSPFSWLSSQSGLAHPPRDASRGVPAVSSGRVTLAYFLLGLPAFAVLAYWTLLYARRAWSIVTFPYGWDYGETPELVRAIAVARGRPIYPSWDGPPFQMANYTPLYALANGALVRLFGVQYQSGRALAWGCGLLFCAGLAWLAWREGKTVLAPLVTVLLWFDSLYVWDWTPLGREDELAMLFGIGGLILFHEGVACGAGSWRTLGGAIVLLLAAVYTRQTAIEAAGACGLTLLIRRPRRGRLFLAVFAAAGLAIFGVLDLLTHGTFFLNVVVGNEDVYSWDRLLFRAERFWQVYGIAFVLAAGYAIGRVIRRQSPLLVLWAVLAFAVAITGGKDGAAENYELMPWAATSLLAGLAVASLRDTSAALWRGDIRRVALAAALPVGCGVLLLLQAQLSYHVLRDDFPTRRAFDRATAGGVDRLLREATETGWYRRLLPSAPPPRQLESASLAMYFDAAGPTTRAEQEDLDAIAAAQRGDVLDEDLTHLLLVGKRIWIQPFEFAEAARVGSWDDAPLLRAVEARRFDLVVLTGELSPSWETQRFTRRVVAALAANYCEAGRVGKYWLYRPCPG